jgi:hypothetical protein
MMIMKINFDENGKYDKSCYADALSFHRKTIAAKSSVAQVSVHEVFSLIKTLNSNNALSNESKFYLNRLLETSQDDSIQWLIKNQPHIAKDIIEDARLDVNSICIDAMVVR